MKFLPWQKARRTRNWEPPDDERALLALAGHSTWEQFEADRLERAREIADWCAVTPGTKGFEIGSGEGTVARLLSESCNSLDCCDISEAFLARAKRACANLQNVHFHLIASPSLSWLADDAYDFGYSTNVFIHLNAYAIFNYLTSVKRILKVGGRFFFDACTVGEGTISLFREHAEIYRSGASPEGLLNFNGQQVLEAIIAEAGLTLSERTRFTTSGWFKVLVEKK